MATVQTEERTVTPGRKGGFCLVACEHSGYVRLPERWTAQLGTATLEAQQEEPGPGPGLRGGRTSDAKGWCRSLPGA